MRPIEYFKSLYEQQREPLASYLRIGARVSENNISFFQISPKKGKRDLSLEDGLTAISFLNSVEPFNVDKMFEFAENKQYDLLMIAIEHSKRPIPGPVWYALRNV